MPLLALLEQLQLEILEGKSIPWEVLYILLLWLSLVTLVPFSLITNDISGSPAKRIEALAQFFLSRPGKERDAASVVLGRLYPRRDILEPLLSDFLHWARSRMQVTSSSFEVCQSFTQATGILQTLCAIAKNSDTTFALNYISELESLLELYVPWENKSMLVDRFRTKLAGRLALQLLLNDPGDERVDGLVDTLLTSLGHKVCRRIY